MEVTVLLQAPDIFLYTPGSRRSDFQLQGHRTLRPTEPILPSCWFRKKGLWLAETLGSGGSNGSAKNAKIHGQLGLCSDLCRIAAQAFFYPDLGLGDPIEASRVLCVLIVERLVYQSACRETTDLGGQCMVVSSFNTGTPI